MVEHLLENPPIARYSQSLHRVDVETYYVNVYVAKTNHLRYHKRSVCVIWSEIEQNTLLEHVFLVRLVSLSSPDSHIY